MPIVHIGLKRKPLRLHGNVSFSFLKFFTCLDLLPHFCVFFYLAESTKFFEPKRLVNEPAKNCERSVSVSEFLDSWDSTTGPAFKAEKMIAGAIHMT